MSEPRLRYGQLAPEGLAKMTALEHYLNTVTGIEASLLGFVRLKISLMNGCEYCVRLHTAELKRGNETEGGWRVLGIGVGRRLIRRGSGRRWRGQRQ